VMTNCVSANTRLSAQRLNRSTLRPPQYHAGCSTGGDHPVDGFVAVQDVPDPIR
jgi:hypothetical protein